MDFPEHFIVKTSYKVRYDWAPWNTVSNEVFGFLGKWCGGSSMLESKLPFFGSLLFIGDDHKPNSSSQNKPKMKIAYWWDEFIPNLSRSGLILTRVGQPWGSLMWYTAPGQKNQTNLLWRKTLEKKTNIERRIAAVFAVAHFFASSWNAICVLFFLSNEKPLKPAIQLPSK